MRANDEKAERGSGNVFADLDFRDSEERLLKAKLATKIAQLIEQKSWTQTQTAERTGLDQPKVSHLLRGRLSGFSADRLFAILNRLGHSVEVRIFSKERDPKKTYTRVMIGTHLALEKDAPEPRAMQLPEVGVVVELPLVGGLHHRYERRAA